MLLHCNTSLKLKLELLEMFKGKIFYGSWQYPVSFKAVGCGPGVNSIWSV